MDTDQINTPRKQHCMVVHAYYPLGETRVQREAEALLDHGYEVDVICLRFPNESAFEVVRGINVYRLPIQRSRKSGFGTQLKEYLHFLFLTAFKLSQLYHKKKYNVVQIHNLPDFLVFSALWPKLKGARVILDIHDVMPEFFAERTGHSLDSWLVQFMTWQEQLSCRFADHVITVTDPWRQAIIKRGTAADKTSVVMNVADSQLFHRGVSPRSDTQSQNNTFHLIYHGVQSYRHGLDILLRAIAQVRSHIPGLCLILHGNGEAHNDLVKLADSLGISEQVKFSTKFVPVSDLPSLIAQADIGVVPYRRDIFTDGILPTKLMEYVAIGLPVIASRTPVIETYFDETMLHFFEPENVDSLASSILTLYQDSVHRESLVHESARFNQKYSWSTQAAHYVSLINQL